MRGLLRVNAGGRRFDTLAKTLCRWPETEIARIVREQSVPLKKKHGLQWRKNRGSKTLPAVPNDESVAMDPTQATTVGAEAPVGVDIDWNRPRQLFLDVDPDIFQHVLTFLRSGTISLPGNNEVLRSSIVHQLDAWGLTKLAFPASAAQSVEEGEGAQDSSDVSGRGDVVELPDVVAVQMCDHMQLEQGSKRHAVTITYGSDGFHLRSLCKSTRKDLNQLLSSTYWQMYQTNERSCFFVSTKMSSGSADLLLTSVSQRVIEHTEKMGYSLANSYVTLSPDMQHVSVRVFIHWLIFRRVRAPTLEFADVDSLALNEARDSASAGGGSLVEEEEHFNMFRNFEAPNIGPKGPDPIPPTVPKGSKITRIWD